MVKGSLYGEIRRQLYTVERRQRYESVSIVKWRAYRFDCQSGKTDSARFGSSVQSKSVTVFTCHAVCRNDQSRRIAGQIRREWSYSSSTENDGPVVVADDVTGDTGRTDELYKTSEVRVGVSQGCCISVKI